MHTFSSEAGTAKMGWPCHQNVWWFLTKRKSSILNFRLKTAPRVTRGNAQVKLLWSLIVRRPSVRRLVTSFNDFSSDSHHTSSVIVCWRRVESLIALLIYGKNAYTESSPGTRKRYGLILVYSIRDGICLNDDPRLLFDLFTASSDMFPNTFAWWNVEN